MWVALLACFVTAASVAEASDRPTMPTFYQDYRASMRDQTGAGAVLSLGLRGFTSKKLILAGDVSYQALRGIRVPGPQRGWIAWEGSASALYAFHRALAAGPTFGGQYRMYRQQFSAISDGFMPFAGLTADLTVLRFHWFSMAVLGRFTADLGHTTFVLDDASVVEQQPWDGQLGLRFAFGYLPGDRQRLSGASE